MYKLKRKAFNIILQRLREFYAILQGHFIKDSEEFFNRAEQKSRE
jgi:hypothetical protein